MVDDNPSVIERLVRLETKLDVLVSTGNDVKVAVITDIADHEQRIRTIERMNLAEHDKRISALEKMWWRSAGASAGISTVAVSGVGILIKLIGG